MSHYQVITACPGIEGISKQKNYPPKKSIVPHPPPPTKKKMSFTLPSNCEKKINSAHVTVQYNINRSTRICSHVSMLSMCPSLE